MRRRGNPVLVGGRVGGDGSIIAGEGFSVFRSSAGVYVVTITVPDFRLISAVSTAVGGPGWANVHSAGITQRTFQVLGYTTAAAASDVLFNFVAIGAQQ